MDVSPAMIVEVEEPLEQDEDWDDGRLEGQTERQVEERQNTICALNYRIYT